MFEYKNKPFKEGVSAYVFSPEEKLASQEFEVLLGIASRSLDSKIRQNSPVAQYQDDIYCVPFDPALLPKRIPVEFRNKSLTWVLRPEQKRLHPEDEEGREIIRRLVSKAIAKKQIERGWFVEEYGFAYHWSFNLSKQLYTELMDVYPGFVFRPYVYEDGSCAVMVDPKFKFVPKRNLRDVIEDLLAKGAKQDYVKLFLEDDFVIDACPVIGCPHKKNPASSCRLKGSGKRKRLVQLDFDRKPSQAAIGSLIEYHKDPSLCQFYGKIAEMIIDRPPIALIEKKDKKEFLEYPVERLRQELKLQRLGKPQRLLIMRYIQPPLNERWKLTENFVTYTDGIVIGRLHPLELAVYFAEAGSSGKPWENVTAFEEIPLAFGGQASSHDPFLGLERNGPYDLTVKDRRKFDSIRIMMCNYSSKLSMNTIKKFYNDLVEGFRRGARFTGIKELFKLRVEKFSEDLVLPNLRAIEEMSAHDLPDIVIVFTPRIGGSKIKQYESFKYKLTKRGIPCQFILEDKFGPTMTLNRYVSYMKNLALSIYYKVGGTAWVLSRPLSQNSCYIGLGMITRGETTYMSTQIFDSFGMWLGGWTEFLNRNEYSKNLIYRIGLAQEVYVKKTGRPPRRIVIHKDGEMWTDIEIKPLIDAFHSNLTCVGVKKTPLPRLYDPRSRIDYMVRRGSCVQIGKNAALLATSGPPHPIRGSQRPLLVDVKNPIVDTSQLMDICYEVFNLSLIFGGYSLAVVSKPLTTHFAGKAVSLASKYNIVESPSLWRKAWFI
jgi:hypothetical protein